MHFGQSNSNQIYKCKFVVFFLTLLTLNDDFYIHIIEIKYLCALIEMTFYKFVRVFVNYILNVIRLLYMQLIINIRYPQTPP